MSSLTPSDKKQHLEALKEQYASLEKESHQLEETLVALKNSMTSAMTTVEVEEEKIANNLFRRFDHVWKEKMEAEKALANETHETNSLTRQIAEIQAQLGDVERTIEQEHELMLHKLQKQLIEVTHSKLSLQRALAVERGRYLQLLQERVALVDQQHPASNLSSATENQSPPQPTSHHTRTASAGSSSSSAIRVTSTRSTPLHPSGSGDTSTKNVSQLQHVLNSMLVEQHASEQQCLEDEEFMSLLFDTLMRVQSEATADRDRLANTEAALARTEADLAVASSRAST